MSLPFSEVCTLLQRHENIELRSPPILIRAEKEAQAQAVTGSWFISHASVIRALNSDSSVALLSTLLPERRTDRVYNVKAPRLCLTLSRCLGLSAARAKDLQAYTQAGLGDLGSCLERVLSSGGPPALPGVALDEVDEVLRILAGGCRFSDPSIARLPPGSSTAKNPLIGNVFKRLRPCDAKWLVRLILKDFTPVRLNETQVLKGFHFMLPSVLRFQDRFDAAVSLLKGSLNEYPSRPDRRSETLHLQSAAKYLKPTVGVKVGRPSFHKARSIDHCMRMLGETQWVLERKYDGEYCEVHIDLSKSTVPCECITIFSKSGKDSTADRQPLHQTLVHALRLGTPDCKIKHQAILLGEIVVYSDGERCFLPFDNVRKHVRRSGCAIGTDEDSLPKFGEHLAIVFFDLLLLDDEIVMNRSVDERRQWLREVYCKISGHAMGAEWKMVDFSNRTVARRVLMQQFAASIAQRCEGLVLKSCGVPYFSLEANLSSYTRGYIKLKKDYIIGMGDEADLAVVGGSYTAQQAAISGIPNIKWTDFHMGCLMNKTDVVRFDARPRFKVVGTIRQQYCIPKPILLAANTLLGPFCAESFKPEQRPSDIDLEIGSGIKIDTVFRTPFVFEVLGSGFGKPSNCNFYMLRHARVTKLHEDRSWRDAVSMQELQEQAAAARSAASDSESQETRRWLEKLERKSKRKFERERTGTPKTRTTATPSTAVPSTGRTKQTVGSCVHAADVREPGMCTCSATALDGTTLADRTVSVGSKRPRAERCQTPCPLVKRPRVEKHGDQNVARSKVCPLSDITNQASPPSVHRSSTKKHDEGVDLDSHSILKRLPALFKPRTMPRNLPTASSECPGPFCPLANSTLYLSPCIRHTPYIASDLLSSHLNNDCTTLTSSLSHWERQAFAYPPLTETVSESPAHEGRRKVVLVEGRRRQATREVVRRVRVLGETVEVWDWRILERFADGVEEREEWRLGAIEHDREGGRMRLVGRVEWLTGSPKA